MPRGGLRQADASALAWINLGVAGAAEHDIGKLFVLDKIVDDDSGQAYYPVPVMPSALPGSTCLTLSRPGSDYREDMLFDMEASGYLQSALRFSSAELTQSLKVVSDNRRRQTGRDRQRVSELIAANIDAIDRQAQGLLALRNEQAELDCDSDSWQRLLQLAHFSQTQKNRLRVLWRYLGNRGLVDEPLLAQLESDSEAGAIIRRLEHLSHRDSEQL